MSTLSNLTAVSSAIIAQVIGNQCSCPPLPVAQKCIFCIFRDAVFFASALTVPLERLQQRVGEIEVEIGSVQVFPFKMGDGIYFGYYDAQDRWSHTQILYHDEPDLWLEAFYLGLKRGMLIAPPGGEPTQLMEVDIIKRMVGITILLLLVVAAFNLARMTEGLIQIALLAFGITWLIGITTVIVALVIDKLVLERNSPR